jgi:transposase
MSEQAVMVQLEQSCQEAMIAYRLVHDFQRIMKCRLAEELDGWLKAAVDSGISAMQNFSLGIEKDKAAVVAAVSYEWSQGQVEGQVNRLKLRKRQLYGRANFDLLRQYVLNQI